jgi:hypothetical protein
MAHPREEAAADAIVKTNPTGCTMAAGTATATVEITTDARLSRSSLGTAC